MNDLMYATLTIIVIWAGVFFYVVALDRRLRRLEQHLSTDRESG